MIDLERVLGLIDVRYTEQECRLLKKPARTSVPDWQTDEAKAVCQSDYKGRYNTICFMNDLLQCIATKIWGESYKK